MSKIQIEIPVSAYEYDFLYKFMEPVRVNLSNKMGNYFRYRVDCVVYDSEAAISAVISARIRGIFEIHPALNPPNLLRNFFVLMMKYNSNPGEFIPVLMDGKLLVNVTLSSSLIVKR